jgi:hypothetical protein
MVMLHVKAGAQVDVASPGEVEKILRQTLIAATLEYGRGKKFRYFSSVGTIAGAALVMGDPGTATQAMAPDDGFTWSVKRLTVVGLSANDVVGVYRNSTAPMDAIESGAATAAAPWVWFGWGSRQFILHSDERLIVSNVGNLAAVGRVYVSGMAEEVPTNMEWTL